MLHTFRFDRCEQLRCEGWLREGSAQRGLRPALEEKSWDDLRSQAGDKAETLGLGLPDFLTASIQPESTSCPPRISKEGMI